MRMNTRELLKIGGHVLEWGKRTYIMGVINVTPDSFSGDGLLADSEESSQPVKLPGKGDQDWLKAAVEQGRRMVATGADILDVGGESTRPGAQPVTAAEEMERVLPVVSALAGELDALISIDTYRAGTAEATFQAGAHILNDVWGLRLDPGLAEVAARWQAPVILMHNRSSWAHAEIKERLGGRYVGVPYENLIEDIRRELLESVALARAAGIPDEHIILDPGIGFGKTVEQNLELINRLDEICSLGYPVLVGPSRKSFIGYTLDLPPDQREEGTAAAVSASILRGANLIRVHQVEMMARVARMTDAILHAGKSAS
jgi:dihydropteroate synthase